MPSLAMALFGTGASCSPSGGGLSLVRLSVSPLFGTGLFGTGEFGTGLFGTGEFGTGLESSVGETGFVR